jgi:hypothetical protein
MQTIEKYSVRVVKMAEMDLPGPEVFWMSHWDEWFTAWFYMIVAYNSQHTVVINTGPPSDLTQLNGLWRDFHPSGRVQMKRTDEDKPENVLPKLGIDPEKVDHVIITPLVAYTVGSLPLFKNAKYIISRRGWIEDVFAPPYSTHLPRWIFLPKDIEDYLLNQAHDRLVLKDEGDIVPGIRIWWAGVHHRSSLAITIESTAGRVIVSDCAFSYENVEKNVYLGIGESYAEAMTAYERIRKEADIFIPLYDPEVMKRYPEGKITA